MKLFKKQENKNQFYTLLKHFVRRLFNNDILKYENQRLEWVIGVLVILVMAGGYISHKLLVSYLFPALSGARADIIWVKKATFLTLTMALTGIFSVFNWENIFPDSKDYNNLLFLPVKMKTIYTAKFFSLLAFVGLLSAAFNVFSMFIFTFYLEKFANVNLFFFGFSHFFSNFLANLFVFMAVACIQSIFTILFKNKLFKKISNMIQAVLLLGFIGVIVWIPQISAHLPMAKEKLTSFYYYFPPLWFTGLYEGMVGSVTGFFIPHIFTALIALVVTVSLYLLSFPVTFKRFLSGSISGFSKTGRSITKFFASAKHVFNRTFLRNPIQRAVFYFVGHTFKRSRKHQLQLVMYMALPLAYITGNLLFFHSQRGWSYFKTPNFFIAGASLVFYAFLAAGLRMIVRHPIKLKANWIFQLTEVNEKKHYIKGLKKAFIFLWGFPLFAGLFIFYLYCWGFRLALFHSLYSAAIFLLLLEVFFNTYNKIPFAGEYEPGKPNIKIYWPLILGGFLEWYVLFANMGVILLSHTQYYILFFALVVFLYGGLVWKRYQRYKSEDFQFIYEENPQEPMLSLNIARFLQ